MGDRVSSRQREALRGLVEHRSASQGARGMEPLLLAEASAVELESLLKRRACRSVPLPILPLMAAPVGFARKGT